MMKTYFPYSIVLLCGCYVCAATIAAADPWHIDHPATHPETHQESPMDGAPPVELVETSPDGVTPSVLLTGRPRPSQF
jgi:hypothetical protein